MKKLTLLMSLLFTAFKAHSAVQAYIPVVLDVSSKPYCQIPTTIPFGTHQVTPAFLDGLVSNQIFTTSINITCDTFTPMQINLSSANVDLKFGASAPTDVFDLYVGGGAINGKQLVDTNLLAIGNAIRNADNKLGVLNTATFYFYLMAKDLNSFKSMFSSNSGGSFTLNSLSKTVNFTF